MPIALVLGGAACVWEDVIALEKEHGRWPGLVVAANDVGCYWPRTLDHWCTLHPHKMPKWRRLRQEYYGYGLDEYRVWGRSSRRKEDSLVPWPGGSSGLLAVQVALHVGAERVVLCGVPMTAEVHFPESEEDHVIDSQGRWAHSDKHWTAWEREVHRLRERVRSMSGRTREMLSYPDAGWLSA